MKFYAQIPPKPPRPELGAIYVHTTKPNLFEELVSLLPEKEEDEDE